MVWSTFTNILWELAKSFWLILLLSITKLTKHRHLLCNKHKWWGHPNYLPKWLLNCNSGMSSLNSLAILVTYRYSLRHHGCNYFGFCGIVPTRHGTHVLCFYHTRWKISMFKLFISKSLANIQLKLHFLYNVSIFPCNVSHMFFSAFNHCLYNSKINTKLRIFKIIVNS